MHQGTEYCPRARRLLNLNRSAIAALMAGLAALAAPGAATGQELPPAIQADRYLRQATGHIEDGDGPAALAALDRILTLEAEHGVEIPDAFWFRQAQAALAAEKADMAVEAVTRYLQLTLLEGRTLRAGAGPAHRGGSAAGQVRAGVHVQRLRRLPADGRRARGDVHDGLPRVGRRPRT